MSLMSSASWQVEGYLDIEMEHTRVHEENKTSVTGSSNYSSSSEVKVGSLEMRRVPGIGFSSCAVPTCSHVQGILNEVTN